MIHENALPSRIERLNELANNMWWSWHSSSRAVFRSLDYASWSLNGHNPTKMLRELDQGRLRLASRDPKFLDAYDAAVRELDADIISNSHWYRQRHPEHREEFFAYFSAEFAIHNSLPIYAGGLGILAGDLLKEASDLGVPMVGVGLMYPHGYFRQQIDASGWQQEIYQDLDFCDTAITPVRPGPDGTCTAITTMPLEDSDINSAVKKGVGRCCTGDAGANNCNARHKGSRRCVAHEPLPGPSAPSVTVPESFIRASVVRTSPSADASRRLSPDRLFRCSPFA